MICVSTLFPVQFVTTSFHILSLMVILVKLIATSYVE